MLLTGLTVAASLLAMAAPRSAAGLGLPATPRALAGAPWTPVTGLFLHETLPALVAVGGILLLVGRQVEAALGTRTYLALYGGVGSLAAVIHVVAGASPVISGGVHTLGGAAALVGVSAAAAAMRMPVRWRWFHVGARPFAVVVAGVTGAGAVVLLPHHGSVAVAHLTGAGLGAAAGLAADRRALRYIR